MKSEVSDMLLSAGITSTGTQPQVNKSVSLGTFIVVTDAADIGVGAVFSQVLPESFNAC